METLGFVLRKGGLGLYKVEAFTAFDGYGFTLESGEKVSKAQAFVADPNNLAAAAHRGKLSPPEGMMLPELTADQINQHLASMGFQLDADWQIRKSMKSPFMDLKASVIMPALQVHVAVWEKNKKNPEDVPLVLGLVGKDDKDQALFAYLLPDGTGVPLPEQEGGEFVMTKDRVGFKRISLKWGDWYAYPKHQVDEAPVCSFGVMKWMKDAEPTFADSVKEIVGPDKFVTTEGVLMARGGYNWSVDDLLKGL